MSLSYLKLKWNRFYADDESSSRALIVEPVVKQDNSHDIAKLEPLRLNVDNHQQPFSLEVV